MKERQKKMLRFLLLNKGTLLIDDLAKTFAVGRRTVSRDLDVMDNWLSLKGARLERKQNHGIQVLFFGTNLLELMDTINKPDAYFQSLSPGVRQKLILLYLLLNNREIKISDIANTFFISDTSVWNDLNLLESNLSQNNIVMDRWKGVGIRVQGKEDQIRLQFLTTMTEVFSSKTIIPYLYSLKEDRNSTLEINQFKLLMNRLKFPRNSPVAAKVISETTEKLGYQFTMSGEVLLYFYLQLTIHRVKSGALIANKLPFRCFDDFFRLGKSMLRDLLERIFSGSLPEGEIQLLGMILQVLEIGEISSVPLIRFDISPNIKSLTTDIINAFSKLDNRLYYLNKSMESVLNLTLASLISRLKYRIPCWHGEWGSASGEDWGKSEKEAVLSRLLEEQFSIKAEKRDLEYIMMHFHSLVINKEDIPKKKIRCLVCCFEGIGLASYLQSILQREVPELNIVEATAVFKIRKEYIDEKGIELIVSTFPIDDFTTPVIPISLPLNKEKLKEDISFVIRSRNLLEVEEHKEPRTLQGKPEAISFNEIMRFIEGFHSFHFPYNSNVDHTIDLLSEKLSDSPESKAILSRSFRAREKIGPLVFEDYGVKVLHCKTTGTMKPRAGIINFNNADSPGMLFMAAPDPCPDYTRKMLSMITLSFLENRRFRNSIISGNLNEIRKNLMDVYKELI